MTTQLSPEIEAAVTPPSRSRAALVLRGLRWAVTIGAIAYLIHHVGLSPIVHRLAAASPAWLLAGYLVAAVSIGLTVWQWQGLLGASGLPRPYLRCLHLELAGDMWDAALPTSVGGDLLRATLVADRPDERVAGAASVLLRRLLNFPGMVVVLAAGLLASVGLGYSGRLIPYAAVALVFGVAALTVVFTPILPWIAGRLPVERRIARPVSKVLVAMGDVRSDRRALFVASLRGIAFWTVAAVSQWCFMRAVGVHVPFAYGAAVVTTTNALTLVPISVGGYGLREGAFSAFLAIAGHGTAAEGVAVGVCLTAQTAALGLAGIPFYLTAGRRRSPAVRPVEALT